MEITFKGRQTDVAARFRDQATAKLEKLERLDQKAIRVDVEVSVERNPRQVEPEGAGGTDDHLARPGDPGRSRRRGSVRRP